MSRKVKWWSLSEWLDHSPSIAGVPSSRFCQPMWSSWWTNRSRNMYIWGFRARQHLRSFAPVMNDDDQMIFGDLVGLKLPDIRLTGEKKPEKISPRKPARPGIEPGPAAWQARMLPPVPQRWTNRSRGQILLHYHPPLWRCHRSGQPIPCYHIILKVLYLISFSTRQYAGPKLTCTIIQGDSKPLRQTLRVDRVNNKERFLLNNLCLLTHRFDITIDFFNLFLLFLRGCTSM